MKKINQNMKKIINKKSEGKIRSREIILYSSPLAGLVITAIVLIALVLLNTPIRNFISDMWTAFSNFVDGKLTTLFGS